MNPNSAPPIELDRQLEIVTQQVIRASIYFDLWWFYQSADTRPRIVNTLNDFGDFFRFDEHAQFVSMIIHCGAIWDNTNGAVGLVTLSRKILNPKKSISDKAISEKMLKYQSEAAALITIRNEAIAHRSATFDYSDAFKRAQLVPGTLPKAMASWLIVINELRAKRNLHEEAFSTGPLDDARRLVHSLGGPNMTPRSDFADIFES